MTTGTLDQHSAFQEFSFPAVNSITETFTATLSTNCTAPCTGDASFTAAETNFSLVPEPSTALLLATGFLGLAVRRRHARSASRGDRASA
jgi:hypothetical protein